MKFDNIARQEIFKHLVATGYTGTKDAFWDEMRRQSYWAEIRLFSQSRIVRLKADYPTLKAFVDRALPLAARRFDSVNTDRGYGDAYISFNKKDARRQEVRPTPLRIEGVTFDFEERENYCDVRVRTYVNNEFRRDRTFRFIAKKGKKQ